MEVFPNVYVAAAVFWVKIVPRRDSILTISNKLRVRLVVFLSFRGF